MLDSNSLAKKRNEILAIAARYGASNVRIFGSVARGIADVKSDLDLLVHFEPGRSLLDQGGMLMELRELLGGEIDLISEGALSGRFKDSVLSDAVPI